MFTQQYYKAIAEIIKNAAPQQAQMNLHGERARGINESRLHIARQFADYFYGDNLHFNRDKFITACDIT